MEDGGVLGEREDDRQIESEKERKEIVNDAFTQALDECFQQGGGGGDPDPSVRRRNKTCEGVTSNPKRRHRTDDKGDPLSVMCHQCQRNDKGRVVTCGNCKWKRYCVPCMTTWYPKMTEDDFARFCPVCQVNCNCKSCLCLQVLKKDKERFNLKFTIEERI